MATYGVSYPRKPSISFIIYAQLPNSQSGTQLTSFTFFSKLSTELRFKIWAFCRLLQRPRLVEIRTLRHDCVEHHKNGERSSKYCPRYSPSSAPVLWHVCQESRMVAREEALRAGNLCFLQPKGSERLGLWDGGISFNHETDRLYLPLEKTVAWQLNPESLYSSAQPPDWMLGPDGSFSGAPHPITAIEQFKRCHHPERVRFLAIDLDIHSMQVSGAYGSHDIFQSVQGTHVLGSFYSPNAAGLYAPIGPPRPRGSWGPRDPVWTVMRTFSKVEDLVFVIDENGFVYGDFVRRIERFTNLLKAERQRFNLATYRGSVRLECNWPRVRLAVRCEGGGLMDVELDVDGR